MTEQQAEQEYAHRAPVLLRQAREAAGLHIAALAASLKVPVRKLEALEEGRYDELPDMTFARALASGACRHLRIDPGPVLAQIPQPGSPTLGQIPRAISAPFRTAAVDLGGSAATGSGGMKLAAWAAGILVAAAAVVLLMPERMPWSGSSGMASPDGEAVSEPPVRMEDGATVETVLPMPVPEAQAPADEAAPAAPAAPDAAAAAAPATPAAAEGGAAAGAGLLALAARGDSWVEVTNGSGAVVLRRMVRAGDTLDFSSAPPYTVVLGRADQVDVAVRGRPFDVLPLARNGVARFEVK